ncbi:MAG: hypothetical protein ACXVW7_11825, partial [Trebonia sp.]
MTQTPPPMLLTPAATAADPSSSSTTTTVDGSITLSIAGHNFTLTGTIGDAVIVEYHVDFDQAISLGSLNSIVSSIDSALGRSGGLSNEITGTLSKLNGVPGIGPAFTKFEAATIRITDLEINTQTSTYGAGIALDFTQSPLTLLGISLLSVGVKVTVV